MIRIAALQLARHIGEGPLKHTHTFDPTMPPWVLSVIAVEQAKSGRREQSTETFRDAVDRLSRIPKLSSRRRLTEIASNQAETGDFVGALRTAESVDPESLVRTVMQIAEKQRESGDQEGTRATLQLALKKAEAQLGHLPQVAVAAATPSRTSGKAITAPINNPALTLRWKDHQLGEIAAIHARLGDLNAAVDALRMIRGDPDKGPTARDIAEARARGGDPDGALGWALTLQPESLRVWALRGLAAGTLPRQ